MLLDMLFCKEVLDRYNAKIVEDDKYHVTLTFENFDIKQRDKYNKILLDIYENSYKKESKCDNIVISSNNLDFLNRDLLATL